MGKTTYEDQAGNVIYSASAIGQCPLALFYDRIGLTPQPPPGWLQERYDQGHDNEPIILDLFERDQVWKMEPKETLEELGFGFGEYMPDRDQDYSNQVRVELPLVKAMSVAHLDGMARLWARPLSYTHGDLGDRRIVEAKAFADSMWNDFQRKGLAKFPKYEWQLSVQMYGAGKVLGVSFMPAVFVVGHKDKAGKVFEIKYEFVDEPPVKLGQLVGKIMKIEGAVERGEFESGIVCEPFFPCPFYGLHEGDEGKVAVDGLEVDLIDSLCARYEELENIVKQGKDADKKRKELGKELLEFFNPSGDSVVGEPVLKGDLFEVTKTEYWNEGQVKAELLEKDGIDPGKYRQGYTVRYPNVKRIKGGDDGDGERAAKQRGM